jgi:hypothetical protein
LAPNIQWGKHLPSPSEDSSLVLHAEGEEAITTAPHLQRAV